MSYILDALRKADAERERDPARGIHAQPVVPAPRQDALQWKRPVLIGAAVVLAVIAGTLAVTTARMGSSSPSPAQSVNPNAAATTADLSVGAGFPPASRAPQPGVAPAATAVYPPAPPMPAAAAAQVPGPAQGRTAAATQPPGSVQLPAIASQGQGGGRPVATQQVQVQPQAPMPLPPPAGATQSATANSRRQGALQGAIQVPGGAAQAPGQPADRILSVSEAPPEVQKLAVSGGVYSENAAQRMLIVGGQVFNEGSEVASGLVLEQVRPKSAVIRVRGGARYALPF